MNFYFTYGTDGHPFRGGWTRVVADNMSQAGELFRVVHPDRTNGILNCAGCYTEEYFKNTEMYKKGNFGKRELEVIRISVTRK